MDLCCETRLRIVGNPVIMAIQRGEFCLQKQRAATSAFGCQCGQALTCPRFAIVTWLICRINRLETGAYRSPNQRGSRFLLPRRTVDERGEGHVINVLLGRLLWFVNGRCRPA